MNYFGKFFRIINVAWTGRVRYLDKRTIWAHVHAEVKIHMFGEGTPETGTPVWRVMVISGAVHGSGDGGRCGGDSVRTESHRHRYLSLWHRDLLPSTILAAHWQRHTHSCLRWDAHTRNAQTCTRIFSHWVHSTQFLFHLFSLPTESCPEQAAERLSAQQSDEEEGDEGDGTMASVSIPLVVLVMLIICVLGVIIYFQVRAWWCLGLVYSRISRGEVSW